MKPFENPLSILKNGKVNYDLDQFERGIPKLGLPAKNPGAPANRESRKPAEIRDWTGLKVNFPVYLSKTGGEGGIHFMPISTADNQ